MLEVQCQLINCTCPLGSVNLEIRTRLQFLHSLDCPSPNFQCANGLCVDYNYRCDGYNDCRDNSDEQNCSCYRGSVRLVGGESPAEGTVEVCNSNTWGTICDSSWGANDTRVVCSQLGYTNASVHLSKSLFGHGTSTTIWNTFGGCRGTESSLASCRFTVPVNCNSSSLAGARCFGKTNSLCDLLPFTHKHTAYTHTHMHIHIHIHTCTHTSLRRHVLIP